MAQPAMNAKIEELRFRLKTDPKSRLFYPLAEELRKAGQSPEAEQVLRTGLVHHPTYLSAWVSLGRALREQKKDADAVEALSRAMQLDPGNVVAARILGDAYLSLGDKVEAIKKYKLVHALMPSDAELEATIASLDRDLNPPVVETLAPEPEPGPASTVEDTVVVAMPHREELEAAEESPFDRTLPPFGEAARVLGEQARVDEATGDDEPMHLAHEESPFEEPVSDYTAASLTVEAPVGMHIAAAPLGAEVPAPVIEEEELPPIDAAPIAPEPVSEEADVFAPTEDVTNTPTMADLYARQGLTDDARHIYENILARDPSNDEVRAKLDELHGGQASVPVEHDANGEGQAGLSVLHEGSNPKITRLETWLSKVSRKEVGGV
jgi:tetratricopeptide (TPR) repeat protein